MDNAEQIKHLLSLFDKRDRLRHAATKKIAACLNDTLLVALKDLLALPDEGIVWEDILMVGEVLVLNISLDYDTTQELSPFLQLISAGTPSYGAVRVQRTVQLGVSLDIAFKPTEEIKAWFFKAARSQSSLPIPPRRQNKPQLNKNQRLLSIQNH